MRSPVQRYLESVHARCLDERGGALADYIPELATVDPEGFGIALATVDGQVYEVGDTRRAFTIQSISKPFTYGLALADQGFDAVALKVDVEPSGEAFNEISLAPDTERPRNPMINAGAITATSLVRGDDAQERFERIRAMYSVAAGRGLSIDESVRRSESETGHRNRAIGHMLRAVGILEEDPDAVLEAYVQQCSLMVDCRDLALMAATLANGGVNPHSGERALPADIVERVLSVMTTCGMYDAAGDWVTAVGMPAKSGVGGGIIAVLPGQVGIAVYSPRLDLHGNSVRGVEACHLLSRELELHVMHVARGARSAVRASYDVLEVPSRRRRSAAEREVLASVGHRARVFELHGDLLFAGAESVVRAVSEPGSQLEVVVLDVSRVEEVADVARSLLAGLREEFSGDGGHGAIVDPSGALAAEEAANGLRVFATRDAALEWCEERLLEAHGAGVGMLACQVEEHPVLAGLSPADRAYLEPLLAERLCADGEQIIQRGDPVAGLHLILGGRVDALVDLGEAVPRRMSSLFAGMSFGELAMATGKVHEADFVAGPDTALRVLAPEVMDRIAVDRPDLAVELWKAMAREAFALTDRALRELVSLTSTRSAGPTG